MCAKSKGSGVTPANSQQFIGINGVPWPPDVYDAHLDYDGGTQKGIADTFGIDYNEAGAMLEAVKAFTGADYGDIRDAQAAGDEESEYGYYGLMCEEFIKAGVDSGNGWTGGPTYRGLDGISDEAYQAYANLKVGDSIDPNHGGTASWSTEKDISFEEFSGWKNSVVFVHAGKSQPKGVSVNAISTCKGEMEVLVSKDAKYKVQNVVNYVGNGEVGYNGTNYLLIYVEDA